MILDEIIAATKIRVENQKKRIPLSLLVKKPISSNRDFFSAVAKKGNKPNIIAEIKLASPLQGRFFSYLTLEQRIKKYEEGGATAISLVTEPSLFKGDLEMIEYAKQISVLPILQKDFIVDDYQIYQAKAYGADALLLIAKILSQEQLKYYVDLCFKLNMEPVIEVANKEELKKALGTNTRCVAINARNLETLTINLKDACQLGQTLPKNKIFLAFSGVKTKSDFELYAKAGAKAVLIGTALMRLDHPELFIKSLKQPLVKICGIKSAKEFQQAQEAGADMIGFLFVKNRKRTVSPLVVSEIIKKASPKCKTVGVFVNEKINKVLTLAKQLKLDFVQLHGDESPQYVKNLKKNISVIKAFRATKKELFNGLNKNMVDYQADYLMLDRKKRSSDPLPIAHLKPLCKKFPLLIAGGLNVENVAKLVKMCNPTGVDVSSGVEKDGIKDAYLMRQFVASVRKAVAIQFYR